jgi:hypothetical protein
MSDREPPGLDADEGPDPQTSREALEQELMDEGRSEEGEQIGDEIT